MNRALFRKGAFVAAYALAIFSFLFVQSVGFAQSPLNLKHGRWAGTFRPNHTQHPIGVKFDIFLTQPNDVGDFPKLEAISKFSLGGILGYESHSMHFENIQYDFGTGDLTFDEGNSNFLIQAKVVGEKKITGVATNVATGVSGPLELYYVDKEISTEPCEPDEPCDVEDPLARLPRAQYQPIFGQLYTGQCDSLDASLELSSANELSSDDNQEFLNGYSFKARLGLKDRTCVNGTHCVSRAWDSVQFDFFRSKVVLNSNQFTDECSYEKHGGLTCKILMNNVFKKCSFAPTKINNFNFSVFERSFNLVPNADEDKRLPETPASIQDLQKAVTGVFTGYLFHERDGRYQPMQIGVTATVSTDNPHNEPYVYVSGLTKLFLGKSLNAEFATFRFDRRTFFPSQGFSLRSDLAGVFLVVQKWRAGFISGTLYSDLYGRIGSVELKRSSSLPALPAGLKPQTALAGVYQGRPRSGGPMWKLELRNSTLNSMNGLVSVLGTAQMISPGLPVPRFKISDGNYNLFTGRLSLVVSESETSERILSGQTSDEGVLLRFGSSSAWGAMMSGNPETRFERIEQ